MVDPRGINFDLLERFKANYQWRRDIIEGKLENPYNADTRYPLPPSTGGIANENYRCSKYEYHRTFPNSVLCPDCGGELLRG